MIKHEVTADSGAVVSVTNERSLVHIPTQPNAASRAGVTYRVANGQEVPNKGEKKAGKSKKGKGKGKKGKGGKGGKGKRKKKK